MAAKLVSKKDKFIIAQLDTKCSFIWIKLEFKSFDAGGWVDGYLILMPLVAPN